MEAVRSKVQGIVVMHQWKNWDVLFCHVLSLSNESKDESYREQQEHQSRISNQNTLVEFQLKLTEVTWKITETNKL